MRMGRLLIGLAVLPALSAVAASPAEKLLDVVLADVTQPQMRCQWAADHMGELEDTLSLYRQAAPRLVLRTSGVRPGDSAVGVGTVVFETRLLGPATVTLTLDDPHRRARIKPGQLLEISLTESRGGTHPLFCGVVFSARRPSRLGPIEVSALMPRHGAELVTSRRFRDQRRTDVITSLANEAGLQIVAEDPLSRPVVPSIVQRNVADWTFMRQLAATERLELTLLANGSLRYAPGTFSAPSRQVPRRKWTDMTWTDVAVELAAEEGMQASVEVTQSVPVTTFAQHEENLAFAHDLAARHEHSAFLAGNELQVRDDGVWRRNPALGADRKLATTAADLAGSIARRHGLALAVQKVPRRQLDVAKVDRTDAEFLLSVLAANGLRLERRRNGLLLRPSAAPGDVTDLLLSRVVVRASGSPGRLTREYADVAAQLLAPLENASSTLTLELGGPVSRLAARPAPTTLEASTRMLAAGDVGLTARRLEDAITSVRAGAGDDVRERFLVDLARVYRPTLLFLYRTDSGRARTLAAMTARR